MRRRLGTRTRLRAVGRGRAPAIKDLFANDLLDDLSGLLEPESFSEPLHQRLYEATAEVIRAGRLADPTTVQGQLRQDSAFAQFGGVRYLFDLLDRCSVPAARDHARVIADLATRRALVDAAGLAIQEAGNPAEDGQAHIAALEASLSEIANKGAVDEWIDGGVAVAQAVAKARARDGSILFTWGIEDLDAMTGGLNAGESVIVAGRPGMMKSGVGVHIALANARKGLGCATP